jgi:hypothetical protein
MSRALLFATVSLPVIAIAIQHHETSQAQGADCDTV